MSSFIPYIPVRRPAVAKESFKAEPATIGSLFAPYNPTRIVIPQFQRGYMWLPKHVQAFWDDVEKLKIKRDGGDTTAIHFFGPIVTLSKDQEQKIFLLDGQQRLATATIMLSVIGTVGNEIGGRFPQSGCLQIADRAKQSMINESGGFNLELGETDASFFREYVQEFPDVKPKAEMRTHRNIIAAHNFLLKKMRELVGATATEEQAGKACKHLTTMRSILLNELVMSNIPVLSDDSAFNIFETLNDRGLRLSGPDLLLNFLMQSADVDDRQHIRDRWTSMLQRIGTHDANVFLRHMWISKFGDLKNNDLFSALKNRIQEDATSSLDFVRDSSEECDNYIEFIDLESNDVDKEPTRTLLKDLQIQAVLPLMLACYPHLTTSNFAKVLKLLIVFLMRHSVIANMESKDRENLLYGLAKDVREAFTATPPTMTEGECIHTIKTSLTTAAPQNPALKPLIQELLLDVGEARYVIDRVAKVLQSESGEIAFGNANIEHIFPQSPDVDEWGGKDNCNALEPYTWNIGNLTLLSRTKNRKGQNKGYEFKKEKYQASEIVMSKNLPRYYADWSVESITTRADKIGEHILKIWSFEDLSRV